MKKLKYLLTMFCLILMPKVVKAEMHLICPSNVIGGNTLSCALEVTDKYKSVSGILDVPSTIKYVGIYGGTYTNLSAENGLYLRNDKLVGADIIGYLHFDTQEVANNTTIEIIIKSSSYVYSDDTKSAETDIKRLVTLTPKPTTTTAVTKTFKVVLDANGGSGTYEVLSCSTKNNKCNVKLSNLKEPTYEGKTFTGWGSTKTCTTGSKSTYSVGKDVTLYACWIDGTTTTTTKAPSGQTTTTTTTKPTTKTTTTTNISDMKLYLKTLSIEGQKIDFSKFKTNYELKVLYDVDTLKLTAEPATEGTTVELPEDLSLQVGENNFEIKLTDGTVTSTYTIRVIRLKEGEEIKEVSKDATLKVLTLSGYNINFSPTKTVYELKVKYNVKQIAVTATPNDENAKYVITGNTDIKNGSVIKVDVQAEDGTLISYKINITQETFFETFRLYFIIGAGAVLLILVALIIVDKTKNKKKVPKTTVVKKSAGNVKKSSKETSKPNVEVLKM